MADVDTYAKCAAADTLTTAVGLATGRLAEANPLTRALQVKALGKVAGTLVPVIGLSIAGYYLLKWINAPRVTQTVTAATCAIAVNNAYIIATHPAAAAAGAGARTGPAVPIAGPMLRGGLR
jgi:hypothetical protein